MLKGVATCSNLLVPCLLEMLVVATLMQIIVILVPYNVEPLLSQIYTSFQYSVCVMLHCNCVRIHLHCGNAIGESFVVGFSGCCISLSAL